MITITDPEAILKRRPRKLVDLEIHEVSLVDNPANPGARILLAKAAPKCETLEGVARLRAIEAAAQAAHPGLSLKDALRQFFATRQHEEQLYREAQGQAVARPAKRAPEPVDLRKRAIEESEQQHPDEMYEQIRKRAATKFPRLFEHDAHAAVEKLVSEEPALYGDYRRSRRVKTAARVEYANDIIREELVPLASFLREDGALAEGEAMAVALELLPAMKMTRDLLIEKAQAGARVEPWDSECPFTAGSMERAAMVIGLVVEARKLIAKGKAATGVEAVKALLSDDLVLAAKVRGDDAGAAKFEGLTRSSIEKDPAAWREYRRRARA